MITAVDTSVLLDIFGADRKFGPGSAAALNTCLTKGSLVACDVVWAETCAAFATPASAESAMTLLRIDFSPTNSTIALAVGEAWRAYRRAGGTRERVIADFMIGAHALASADWLLTRDRGFYRRYFKGLQVMPSLD